MSAVIVIRTWVANPEKEVEKLLTELAEPSHREEGCTLFALHRGIDAPRRFALVERWATRGLHEKHLTSEYVQSQLKLVPERFSGGPKVTYYEAIPGGDPGKGSLAKHAGSRLGDVVVARHAVRRSSHSTSVIPA